MENANKALSILDDKVPLYLVPGNHDTGPGGGRGSFETEMLDKHFPPSRLEKSNGSAAYMKSTASRMLIIFLKRVE